VKPDEVLWNREEHTDAKHRLLVSYLHAWFPIMADRNPSLNLIDGFAGPGRYNGGEPGSPLLMLDAYLSHRNRTAKMNAARVAFDFIEVEPLRVDYLNKQLSQVALPPNVQVAVHQGEFDQVMGRILDAIPDTHGLAPTFAFIDPFGYTGHSLTLSSRILQFKRCEVLIYVPLPFIARFIEDSSIDAALDNLFGDSSWKAARGHKGRDAARIPPGTLLRFKS
jgi:three-Cys-motif partner protein